MKEPAIELRLWRQFVAVAETLHFGRAAARLHMTQPPLTQAIAQLERLLGVRLFDRTRRSVQLTEAGQALLPQAVALLERARALPAVARSAAEGEAGHLRLGFVSTVGFTFLPQWVQAYRAEHPRTRLDLIEATADVQLPAIGTGEFDAGFLLHSPGFAPPGLDHLRIAQEPLVLALPEQHPLASARSLPLARVLAEPLVLFPRRILPSLHDALFGLYHACRPRAGGGAGGDPDADHREPGLGRTGAGLGARQRAAVPARRRRLPGRRRRCSAPGAALRDQPGVAGGAGRGLVAFHRLRTGQVAAGG